MSTAHLVLSAASSYLELGDPDSLRTFERRAEDALGRAAGLNEKMVLIDQAKRDLRQQAAVGSERLMTLIDFLNRQRLVIRGELSSSGHAD